MKSNLNIKGVLLEKNQLEKYLEQQASEHNISEKAEKSTYPINELIEDFKFITKVYNLLNEHVKARISIHPAGEWLLDNYYIVNENVQVLVEQLTIKQYKKLPGLENEQYRGVARIYVLAQEIVGHRNNKIDKETLFNSLKAYQNKKILYMDELWNLQNFLRLTLIKNIKDICEKIYITQLEKERVIRILKNALNYEQKSYSVKTGVYKKTYEMKCAFVEYMSYSLKKYGKSGIPYINILEEQVNITGNTIEEMINNQHYSEAMAKVSIGNAINSLKNISRINFEEIFEEINGVEEVLRREPANIYENMSFETKAYYREAIKDIAKLTKMSEIYIVNKALEISRETNEHIGYFLIDVGREKLYEKLGISKKIKTNHEKSNFYIATYFCVTSIVTILFWGLMMYYTNTIYSTIVTIIAFIPITEIYSQILNYVLLKRVKPKLVPKLDFSSGIPKECATFVVIPTILNSEKKVKKMIHDLEVYYLANKSENIYFALLGDCTSSNKAHENIDEKIIEVGKEEIVKLNEKYPINFSTSTEFERFHFIYRKREWCPTEQKYLGWERKRGLLTQFNRLLVTRKEEKFAYSTIETEKLPKIRYVITLDSDTKLILGSAFELIGAMAHPLNKAITNGKRVIKGYGIIQPRIGIDLNSSRKSLFTEIYAEQGGTDNYTNAVSDVYQDNFEDAIYTGKGIYDVEVFNNLLENNLPDNIILSHDLLEGNYLKCGLATDILLMDGFPSNFNSFMQRNHRWIRGDWQIIRWLMGKIENRKQIPEENPISELSKFKIIDNLRRSLMPIMSIILFILSFKQPIVFTLVVVSLIVPTLLDIINNIIFTKEVTTKQTYFTRNISNVMASIIKGVLEIAFLPYKAFISIDAICKTIYRLKTKEHLLEWVTSEESDRNNKNDIKTYYKTMWLNIALGIWIIFYNSVATDVLGFLWIFGPALAWYISREEKVIKEVPKEDKGYVKQIAEKTWEYFNQYINEENNYLPPDNWQEGKLTLRTSSTNIGLGLLTIISAYDMGFIELNEAIDRVEKMIETIEKLNKWHGHLFNWYDITSLEPLYPRYISTVDSGNFVGYLYVVKQFFLEHINTRSNVDRIEKLIQDTDFSVLYEPDTRLFSVGYNIEEAKLTEAYYDFLASEARQASLVAIAKKDVTPKHWNSLSRTLTTQNQKKGLVSWSGTAFEYLMPNINVKKYEGSLLDESCKFAIMMQMQYIERLEIPWGISESAYSLRDLNGNYQYKAFGIPSLGMKRGLGEEIVISPYASILAIIDMPNEVIANMKKLEETKAIGEYGFYEAIDYTPKRLKLDQRYEIVKTYMAHHQALIMLSINNFLNNEIIIKRFNKNPEIEAVDILLQERMPNNIVIKGTKERIEKLKYADNDAYAQRIYNAINDNTNLISNADYSIFINDLGEGFSKYKDILINRYKITSDEKQGMLFYIKNIKSKKIWNPLSNSNEVVFAEDISELKSVNGNIKTKIKTTVTTRDMVEIRKLEIENTGLEDETLEVCAYFEPVLSSAKADYSHPVFNNLFLNFEKYEDNILVSRSMDKNKVIMSATFYTENECIGDMDFEIDKTRFLGRNNLGIPQLIKDSKPFSNKIELCVEPILAFRRTIQVKANEKVTLNLIIGIGENKEEVLDTVNEYKNQEKILNAFSLSKARVEAETRYLEIKSKDIELYQKLIAYLIYRNRTKIQEMPSMVEKTFRQEELWKYGVSGDNPILFVKVKNVNDIDTLEELLKFYEYCRVKNVRIDMIIADEEENSYEKYVKDEIQNAIFSSQSRMWLNNGIYILEHLDNAKEQLFEYIAKIIIDTSLGNIRTILKEKEDYIINKNIKKRNLDLDYTVERTENTNVNIDDYKYYNEYGGFSNDGKEYCIILNQNKLPNVWSHVIANKNFGTVVTDNMGGYVWNKNARLNRLTAWNNNPTTDIPSEIIYFKYNDKIWTMNHGVRQDGNNYYINYGFGYAVFRHISDGIIQENTVFVPKEDNIKINILRLKNVEPKNKNLKLIYYVKPVIGEDEIDTNTYIQVCKKENYVQAQSIYGTEEKLIVMTNQNINSYTGNKESFIGNGSILNPEALQGESLQKDSGLCSEACIAVQIEVELSSYEEKNIVLGLGTEFIEKYLDIQNCVLELENIKQMWQEKLSLIQVKTPIESINIMLNDWIVYQTLVCRMWAKTSYYQSGGAYGYRDQLQDAITMKYIDSEILKKQIIRCCLHQFIEGDVEHWWHEDTDKGIRTRFSDDLFWLPYSVCEYVQYTGDIAILDEEVAFREGAILEDGIDEKYDTYVRGNYKESIYKHCIKAIERGFKLGKNGLMKIGSGDWNDGFNTVGNKGIGESVWLSFFVYKVLSEFEKICNIKGDKTLAEKYLNWRNELKKNINQNAWDGRWYRRAYTDDGKVLGTISNEECKIDSIVQSWAIISNAGDNDKKYIAMENLENYLVDREAEIVKILTPPFKNSNLEPGYIKRYPRGVRENGGQYTHAALWVVIAETMLGFGNKAMDLYKMLTPVEHARTKEASSRYKVEPYVISADVYGEENLRGRGGWSWYTGSSGWYYKTGIEHILGLRIEKETLRIEPCIPKEWKEYSIRYKFKNTIYNIYVKNPNMKNTGVQVFKLNGRDMPDKCIKLVDDGKINEVIVEM